MRLRRPAGPALVLEELDDLLLVDIHDEFLSAGLADARRRLRLLVSDCRSLRTALEC